MKQPLTEICLSPGTNEFFISEEEQRLYLNSKAKQKISWWENLDQDKNK